MMLLAVSALPAFAVYEYPEIEPAYLVRGGYRFVGFEGSARAAEYQYLKSSPYLGVKAVLFPFPSRIHLEINAYNENDYFADLGYAYGDKVVARWIRETMYHNLDNIKLMEFNPIFAVDRRDRGDDYGVRVDMDEFYFRGKPAEFPFHLYVRALRVEKEGTAQQRFIGGLNDFTRISRSRDIDWNATEVTVGANSHLGPLEADYSHSEKRFKPGSNDVMSDTYSDGTYPHNVLSETEGSTDTLMVHTSYTGRLVASATLSRTQRENTTSGAEAEYVMGYGELAWTPAEKVSLALKYRKKMTDEETPNTLETNYLGFSVYSSPTVVDRDAMSTTENRYAAILNYRPSIGTAFNIGYSITRTSRDDAEVWNVPDSTTERETTFSMRTRLPKHMKLRARYRHLEAIEPAYNVQPERSDSGTLYLTVFPAQRWVTTLTMALANERRHSLEFKDSRAKDRRVQNGRVMAQVAYVVTDRATVSAAYAYLTRRVSQDMYYKDSASNPLFANDVKYDQTALNYTLAGDYHTKGLLAFHAAVSRTDTKSGFDDGSVSFDSLSELEVSETTYEFSVHHGREEGIIYGLDAKYYDFDDRLDNSDNPALKDGSAYIALVSASVSF